MLQLEQYARFQPNHERDFLSINYVVYAQRLWDKWLNDPRNSDFKTLYESTPEGAQEKLRLHMLQPFRLSQEFAYDREKWDFVSDLFIPIMSH